jgi:hypothetical protein
MKVHEILAESTIDNSLLNENLWKKFFNKGTGAVSAAGIKYASKELAIKYSDDLVKAYQLGIPAKPLTAAYAEKFFAGLGLPKPIAKQLSSNQKILDTATKDADKIMKATRRKLGMMTLSDNAQKIYTTYKWIFAGSQALLVLGHPTYEFIAKLDEQHKLYENKEISLAQYQSRRQSLATVYVGQIAAGIASWAAIRGASGIVKKMVGVFPDVIAKPIQLALRGATDAALLHFEINYLNTDEGRKAIGDFMTAGVLFGFPIGDAMQQSVGAAAVNAGVWIQKAINKSIEVANKVPGINIKTTPGVPAPNAPTPGQDSQTTTPLVKPRTSPETWGKVVEPKQ